MAVVFASMHATPSLGYTDFGKGRPVTAQDLAGKKYCWSSGRWDFYGADGLFSNSRGVRNRPWTVLEPGVVKFGRRGYIQIEVLPDGRLHAYKYCLLCGDHDRDSWATLCT